MKIKIPYPLPVPPNKPNDHCSYGFCPGLLEGGGGFGASLGDCSGLASFPLTSFDSFGGCFNSFAPPGLKYFSNPLGGFSQNSLHSFNTVCFNEKLFWNIMTG